MSSPGHMEMAGLRLREDPARDACFKIVRRDTEMYEYAEWSDAAARETLHRHMSNEITSIDIAAQMLVDFPDAPWELRMELARQAWDETRHVAVLYRRLKELGGEKGEFPISVFEWSVTCALDDIAARLATQNRTFEAGAMDIVKKLAMGFKGLGDDETSAVLEGILADEIQHVRFANRWIKRLVAADRRVLMKVAMAIRFIEQANERFAARAGEVNAVGKVLTEYTEAIAAINVQDRQLAEFSEDEILEVLKQAGFKSIIPSAEPGTADV